MTWEELEKVQKDCEEAKGNPMGMKLIQAGLIEKLVGELKSLHELMIYIHALFVHDDSLTTSAWAALMVLSDKITNGMRPKDLIMGATQKFYDDWAIRNQPSEKDETVIMCDPRELGVIFDEAPRTIKIRERYALALKEKKGKKRKLKKGESKGGLCLRSSRSSHASSAAPSSRRRRKP
jgi:hypothetical protein